MIAFPKAAYISPEEYLLGENDRPDGIRYEYVNSVGLVMAVNDLYGFLLNKSGSTL